MGEWVSGEEIGKVWGRDGNAVKSSPFNLMLKTVNNQENMEMESTMSEWVKEWGRGRRDGSPVR